MTGRGGPPEPVVLAELIAQWAFERDVEQRRARDRPQRLAARLTSALGLVAAGLAVYDLALIGGVIRR